ncbi:nicotinate-nicotinamide nucleotide adenylyltransferase [Psychrobacter sp. I-STPA10]|uniref:nicotinate-nicotinamide nucleotide adenylyltransferase n=1 Tax=Psychrobacter sp. I-STPA10 TaxID=2585769 RepID=UPI001E49A689|nr:nicotinate-nicotinamide nucleotide adenylyltransferase [Psychrobacter sp. I-STPA10]
MNKSKSQTDNQSKQINAVRLFLGGSFDPVHHGHITLLYHVATQLRTTYPLDIPVYASFLPAARSPLKDTSLAPKHRLNMLKLAIAAHQNTLRNTEDTNSLTTLSSIPITPSICELELWQTPPTYTIDTLQTLRAHYPNDSIIFIMGADNVASLPKWRCGLLLTTQAHLWICPRNDWQDIAAISAVLPTPLHTQITTNTHDLKTTPSGRIYIDSTAMMAVSSSQIRQQLQQHQNSDDPLATIEIARDVYDYIRQHHLYV